MQMTDVKNEVNTYSQNNTEAMQSSYEPAAAPELELKAEPVKQVEVDTSNLEESKEKIDQKIEIALIELEAKIKEAQIDVQMVKDDRVDGYVAHILDHEGKLIKSLPPETILKIRDQVAGIMEGIIFDNAG